MSQLKYIVFAFSCMLALFSAAASQDKDSNTTQRSSLTITAGASGERVRITAPASVVQMRVEVFAANGVKLFDNEIRGGNVFDWYFQDGQAQRLSPDDYVCVVTVKNISGKITQKIGAVKIGEKEASVEPFESAQLSPQQSLTIGPVEDGSSWTVLPENENQTTTVIAHDGTDGQIVRGHGALSFRVGDFFSGNDKEQMRLTEEGNLGIGTSKPQAKLDVAGDVRAMGALRAEKGIEFPDGTVQTTGLSGRKDKEGNLVPNVAGTGTTNQVAKWTDSVGTLGNSTITETGGRVGIGVTSPSYKLVVGPDIGPGLTTSDLTVSRGQGQSISAFVGASGANGMNFGWDEANQRAFVNAPVQSPITFTHGGVSERMRIETNGFIGIGTPTPGAKLDVAGDVNSSTQYNISGNRALGVTGGGGAFANSNTFTGVGAGASNTPSGVVEFGNRNSFFGLNAGNLNTTGAANSFVGMSAGRTNATGKGNSFFGDSAGSANTTGSFNTIVGRDANVGANNLDHATAIGAGAVVNTSNTIALGRSDGSDTVQAAGTLGGNIINATTQYNIGGSRVLSIASDSLILGNGVNVGIGTTAPAAKLTVSTDSTSAGENTATFKALNIGPNQSHIHYGTTGNWFIRSAATTGNVILQDTGGNVGIGTTAPNARLEVNGQGGTALAITNGAFRVTGAGVGTNTAAFIFVKTAANTCGGAGGIDSGIDNPLTNGDPNAILIVTARNGSRVGTPVANSRLAVSYFYASDAPPGCPQLANRWVLQAFDGAPADTQFSVLVIKP
ncbi:MAG: hypothetical protein ABJA18_00935 [bacterium]